MTSAEYVLETADKEGLHLKLQEACHHRAEEYG